MDKYHHVIERYKNGNLTMESWNLPFQISRSCEVGITDNVNIVIGADSWRLAESGCLASCELIIALLTEQGTGNTCSDGDKPSAGLCTPGWEWGCWLRLGSTWAAPTFKKYTQAWSRVTTPKLPEALAKVLFCQQQDTAVGWLKRHFRPRPKIFCLWL